MENNINEHNKVNDRTVAGFIIIFIGSLLLIDQLNLFYIPAWLFSWPMWLIGISVYLGAKHNFNKPVYSILIVIGILFLVSDNIARADAFIWPLAIIGTGSWLVFRDKQYKARFFNSY